MVATLNHSSPVHAKIGLFRELFRGRLDVYAKRFTSKKSGLSGYQPACGNEWVRGVCEKPRIKCSECNNQRFLNLSEEVVRWHLSGKDDVGQDFVLGVYPMLLDETCCFLAVDFDGDAWKEDCAAFMRVLGDLDIPACIERSRSGEGGHVWIFFESPIPAVQARKLGLHVLTEVMESRPEIGMKSYDRLFPNQDTLPKGGFGNLIALPLQKGPREKGNSVFVDHADCFQPHPDQWEFLASLKRLSRARVEEIAKFAEGRGRIVGATLVLPDNEEEGSQPWALRPSRQFNALPVGPMPERLSVVLGDQIYLKKVDLPPSLRNRFIRLVTFQNPEFYKAQAMRLPTYDKPRMISCAEEHGEFIALPRGCLGDLHEVCRALKIQVFVEDKRHEGGCLGLLFTGTLRPDQQKAAEALKAHDIGVLAATTAFGKTVVATWLVANRDRSTLVLVHRQQLLEQWVDRLAQFLGIPRKEIGQWGGGSKKLTGRVDVALMQSVVRKGQVQDLVGDYGHLVVDECHHLSARSFELVARRAKAKFVTGLSATVARKDGHHPIIFMQCGPVRYRVSAKLAALERPFSHEVIVRPTGFRAAGESESDARMEFQRLYTGLVESEFRNLMIRDDVLTSVRAGRTPVVLTERTAHLDKLVEMLRPMVPHLVVLQGGMKKKELLLELSRLSSLPVDEARVVIATGKFVGEGFDDPRLDTLFITMPVSWRGTIAQYVGRLHRLQEGKKVVQVYDYADLDVPMLSRMFDKRCEGYEAAGYTILLPASALPGWPSEVPLPVDAQWKSDYAASVRRLIQDGVDSPLGNRFVHVTRAFAEDAEGAERARSASEAFLYHRLESIASTQGKFQLNARLPIPFDDRSEMEADLLCESLRLVIEIDGDQHLSSHEAYRRDRRKDLLLQLNGYMLLRFLASDIGKRLDMVLDAIHMAMGSRVAHLL
ncbi:MAG: DEAD/DEAH box helicase family protein [Verrucomicrobium sp.]